MRQEVDSRDEVMHNEMSDWWFLECSVACPPFVQSSFYPLSENSASRLHEPYPLKSAV